MERVVSYTSGVRIPITGHGIGYDFYEKCTQWSFITNGLIQRRERETLNQYVYAYGKPPYAVCAASGYRFPVSQMVRVDGVLYGADFAPASRKQWG